MDIFLKQCNLRALQYVLETSETVVSLQQYFINLSPPLWQEGKYIDSQEFYGFCQCDGAQQLPIKRLVDDLIFKQC